MGWRPKTWPRQPKNTLLGPNQGIYVSTMFFRSGSGGNRNRIKIQNSPSKIETDQIPIIPIGFSHSVRGGQLNFHPRKQYQNRAGSNLLGVGSKTQNKNKILHKTMLSLSPMRLRTAQDILTR